MNISIIDGSNYYRGLLLLIKKDDRIALPEIELMRRIGKSLGFEKEFIETCIQDILENEYIAETPPVFSSKELAIKFIKDGLTISTSDMEIHLKEEEWLRSVAELNGIDNTWFVQEKQNAIYVKEINQRLEVEDLKML